MRKILTIAFIVAVPRAALACPVCFGQTDSPLASATNMGIIVMLGVVGAVLSGFAAFIVHLNRRARIAAAAEAGAGASGGSGRITSDSSLAPQEGIAQC